MSGAFRFDPTARGAALALCEAAIAAAFPDVPEMAAHDLSGRREVPPVVLDVRAPEEHAVGRIPGSRLVAPDTPAGAVVSEYLSDAELLGGAPIVCACAVGLRSGRMARALLAHGLARERVFNLRGGIFRWARLDLPMVDDWGPTRAVHPFDARWGRLLRR